MSGFASIFIFLLVLVVIKSVLSKGKQEMRQSPIQDDDMVENNGPRAGYGSTYNTLSGKETAKPENVTVDPEILKKSKEEVNEDFDYDIIRQAAEKHENCIEGHYEESADFMKTVQDLMVMGPNCSMSYERDFIAEGEKMLSGYVGDRKSV